MSETEKKQKHKKRITDDEEGGTSQEVQQQQEAKKKKRKKRPYKPLPKPLMNITEKDIHLFIIQQHINPKTQSKEQIAVRFHNIHLIDDLTIDQLRRLGFMLGCKSIASATKFDVCYAIAIKAYAKKLATLSKRQQQEKQQPTTNAKNDNESSNHCHNVLHITQASTTTTTTAKKAKANTTTTTTTTTRPTTIRNESSKVHEQANNAKDDSFTFEFPSVDVMQSSSSDNEKQIIVMMRDNNNNNDTTGSTSTDCSTTTTNTITDTILKLNEKLLDSIATNDWFTYNKLCDDTITCFDPKTKGQLVKGKEFHKYYFDFEKNKQQANNNKDNSIPSSPEGTTTRNSITSRMISPHVRLIVGDNHNVAIVSYIQLVQQIIESSDDKGTTTTTTLSSKIITTTTKFEVTSVWEKNTTNNNNTWKHVHFHKSSIPTKM